MTEAPSWPRSGSASVTGRPASQLCHLSKFRSAVKSHGLAFRGPSAHLPAEQGSCPACGLRVTSPCLLLPGISNAEARQPGKAPNFSVNWTVGDSAIEVINATTGKDELGRASRLCKHALYCRWMRVHGKVLRCPRGSACRPHRCPSTPLPSCHGPPGPPDPPRTSHSC